MRILICGTTYHPALNGQAIFTTNLARGLAGRGHQVVCLFPSEHRKAYAERRDGVQLEGMASLSAVRVHPDSFVPLPARSRIRRILDELRPQVVHLQDHYPLCRRVAREARRRGIRLVGTNHFMPANVAPYLPGHVRFMPLLERLLWAWMLRVYRGLDVVTAQSLAAAEILRQRSLGIPVHAVSCGIDLDRFRPDPSVDRVRCRRELGLDPTRTLLVFVGRVDREKRIDVLIRAMQRLDRPDLQLAVVGRGAASEALQSLAQALELGDRVRFTGFVHQDLHVLLNSADIFVMASEAELLSLASLEAMACGLPLLLADAVALPELVEPGINGYLFAPGDPDDAARCIAELADHPERWAAMGAASVARAQPHGLERTLERYEALYRPARPALIRTDGPPATPRERRRSGA